MIYFLVLLVALAGCQKASDEEKIIDTLEKWGNALMDKKADPSKYEVDKDL